MGMELTQEDKVNYIRKNLYKCRTCKFFSDICYEKCFRCLGGKSIYALYKELTPQEMETGCPYYKMYWVFKRDWLEGKEVKVV